MNIPEKYKRTLEELVKLLDKVEGIDKVILYGDVAREDVNSKSTLEVCIVTSLPGNDLLVDARYNKAFYLILALGLGVEVNAELYHLLESYQQEEVMRDGIVVYRRG